MNSEEQGGMVGQMYSFSHYKLVAQGREWNSCGVDDVVHYDSLVLM